MRKLLETTSNFDDAITNVGLFIYDTLIAAPNNSREYTFYFFQDFTVSLTDDNKDKIGKVTLNRQKFIDAGYTNNKAHIVHFIRSVLYGKLADQRTLKYFNKIILQS